MKTVVINPPPRNRCCELCGKKDKRPKIVIPCKCSNPDCQREWNYKSRLKGDILPRYISCPSCFKSCLLEEVANKDNILMPMVILKDEKRYNKVVKSGGDLLI